MALRFRRSIKLAPGIRLNMGLRGASLSVGPRGASVNIGRRGVTGHVGIPGSGISYGSRLLSKGGEPPPAPGKTRVEVTTQIADDGTVTFLDGSGNPVPNSWIKKVREQRGDQLREFLERACSERNAALNSVLNIHLDTLSPDTQFTFKPAPFEKEVPKVPKDRGLGVFGRLLSSVRERIEKENQQSRQKYELDVASWEQEKREHDVSEEMQRRVLEEGRFKEPEAMHQFLSDLVSAIDWPRETTASFEISPDGSEAFIDVDLPEVEDMPDKEASVATRGIKLNMKVRGETQRRKDYMVHVHGIGFRLVGVAFAALPSLTRVVASGYTQRPNKATGNQQDDYLFSVRVSREAWSKIDFSNLGSVDPVAALGEFEIIRNMTATGVFKAIQPISPSWSTTSSAA